jgi:RHS repeat-associated protein
MKRYFRSLTLAFLLCLFIPQLSRGAQSEVGIDNPTGVTGEYNGSITTGGSYDPYTGNAKRFIDDLTVTGSVGAYPLKWTRVLNTRGGSGAFGNGGGWKHSYQWGLSILPPPDQCIDPDLPGAVVSYPDGRKMTFRRETQPPRYEDSSGGEPGDRLVQIGTSTNYDLKLKDGGRVEFRNVYGWDHFPQYIVDPYGQRTTLEYNNNGSGVPSLSRIIEPAGRYLKITYRTIQSQVLPVSFEVIHYVEAWDGVQQIHPIETVQYDYEEVPVHHGSYVDVTFLNLIRARYDDDTRGEYHYLDPALLRPGDPRTMMAGHVWTCDDVRFSGPMKRIEYDYVPAGTSIAYGQIRAERNMTTHQVVSSVDYPQAAPTSFTRTETRGDGAKRLFTYFDYSPELKSYTDFYIPGQTTPHTTTISYPGGGPSANSYLRCVSDARPEHYTTTVEKDANTGAVLAVIHPVSVDHPNISKIQYHYTDDIYPYYIDSKTDENGNPTFYDRYCVGSNPVDLYNPNRVWRIRYPDGGWESFKYNNFGQVVEHRMTSEGTEKFTYTTRGLKETYTPNGTASDGNPSEHPTRYFYYDAGNAGGHFDRIDRLYYVTDPLFHSTFYDYNERGQVVTVTHHDNKFTQNQYYDDGTLHIFTDELGHSTTYTYDEYKRVRSVENAEGEVTETSYDPGYNQDQHMALTHTTSSIYQTTSPMGKVVRHWYDLNFRVRETTEAPGSDDVAVTSFTYDEVGNQVTITRPNGQDGMPHPAHSTIEYNDRNLRKSLTDELGHKTSWIYDEVGNLKKETRADLKFRTWDTYDAMNRIKHTTGFLNEQTSYDYDFAGNLRKTTDANLSVYETTYDRMNRKQSAIYPLAGSASAEWRYDAAGNVRYYKNTANQYKHFGYDTRNRQVGSYWNTSEGGTDFQQGIGDRVATVFDDASRVTSVAASGQYASTLVNFEYDRANRKKWEDQTLNNDFAHTRRVQALPNQDGNRGTLTVPGLPEGYAFTYDYTSRQQLGHINKTGDGQYFEYTYDKNGNLEKRQDKWQGGDSTIFSYDRANRVTLCVQTGANDEAFSRSNYNDYDLVNNLKSITREEDHWKGERFEYDDANQLKSVSYRVDVAPNAPEQADPVPGQQGMIEGVSKDSAKEALVELVADPDREPLAGRGSGSEIPDAAGPRLVTYLNDAINRRSMTDDGAVTNYTPNSLNQYTAVANHAAQYDTKFNLWKYEDWVYTYDADQRLISADSTVDGGHHAEFVYDGLGRCVRRTIDGTATVFTYDEWKPIVEWTGAGVFVAWNLYGPEEDEILVRYQPNLGGYVHYKLDAMGNVQFLLSGQLNLGLEKYTYDAFGQPKIRGWNGEGRAISHHGNRFMFTGREYLYTLGIYDYRHRHYHPGLGRFIQTDPVGFGGDPLNLYRYCSGNPVLHGDPTGLVATGRDSIWEMAAWFDSANTNPTQGSYQEHLGRLDEQAGGVTMAQVSVSKRDEGPKLMPLSADLLARMYATHEQNVKEANDPANLTTFPGKNKTQKEEYATGIYSKGKGLVQDGPNRGWHDGVEPQSAPFRKEYTGGGTRAAGTHVHVTGNGMHLYKDQMQAERYHYISGTGSIYAPRRLDIFRPFEKGPGGRYFHSDDGVHSYPGHN